jgi:hypothetical protein
MFDPVHLGDNVVPVLGIICGCLVAAVWIIAAYYRSVQVADMDATLKMEMIQRGMSADEIERVLKAKSEYPAADRCRRGKSFAAGSHVSDAVPSH